MGCSKQLLPLADKPVIRWCLDALLAAGLEDILVVLGPTGQEVADRVKDLPVTIVRNNDPDSDMAGSVKTGLNQLGNHVSAVLVCLVDHPLVSPETINTLTAIHALHPDKIILPLFKGRRGHPTIFPRAVIAELFSVPTLRDIVHKDLQRLHLVQVADEGVVLDMDTPDEYQRMQARFINP